MDRIENLNIGKKPNLVSPVSNQSIVYVLALGVFGIITTEFGVIGILPASRERTAFEVQNLQKYLHNIKIKIMFKKFIERPVLATGVGKQDFV